MTTVALTSSPTTLDPGTAYELFIVNSGTAIAHVQINGGLLFDERLNVGQSIRVPTGGNAVTAYVRSGSGQVTVTATAANPQGDSAHESGQLTIADAKGTYVARGSGRIDLNAAPYSAVVGTDITTKLQAALDYIAASCPSGGEIYFSEPGTYLINGAQQTGTAQSYAYSGQVLIPAVSLANSKPIVIRGPFRASSGSSATGPASGVILSTNATTGNVFDIIPGFTEFGCPWTGVMPIFEDLVFQTPDNPTCGVLNLLCTQRAKIDRVGIKTPTAWVAPVAGTRPAVVMPQIYNNGDCPVHDLDVRGQAVAVMLGEHAVFDNLYIENCLTAFKGNGSSHANFFNNVGVYECPTIFDGGSAPAYGTPPVGAGTAVMGSLDIENNKAAGDPLAPVAFVKDSSTNKVSGKLDLWGTFSGSYPSQGGLWLDVVPVAMTPSQGPRQTGVGWREQHPYDNFTRQSVLSGAGAPGQCSPSLHPWRVEAGSFTVTGGVLKGLTGTDKCFVPVKSAGNFNLSSGSGLSRTITLKCTLATGGTIRLYACAPWSGTGAVGGGANAIEVRLSQGSQAIFRVNNANITSIGSTLTAAAHTIQLVVYHNAVGYPYAAKVYIDGALVLSEAVNSTLGGGNPSLWPYYEDGIYFADTTSSVSLFAVQDTAPDVPFVKSATATLVAGTVTVANTAITSSSRIRVFNTGAGGTPGALSVSLNAGVGFTINSTSGTDTSSIYYEIVNY